MTDPADVVAAQVEPERPDRPDAPPEKLFSDLRDRDPEFADGMLTLWQRGQLVAQWNDELGETEWQLSAFGEALIDAGLDDLYERACEADVDLDDPAPALDVTGAP